MEFVDGPTLADRLAAGRLPMSDALALAIKIADALAAAHDKGIVHRDLKPSNIKIPRGGGVKLLDFGIAKETTGDAPGNGSQPTTSLTRQGAILGTAAYMSPEQARGGAIDKRTDIWAFGCVLFEMLTGRRPFEAESTTDTIAKILERDPDWTALPAGTPEAVRKLLRRCLNKDAGERLRDIADARLELVDAASDRNGREESRRDTSPPRSVTRWVAIAAFVVIAAFGIWAISRTTSRDQSPEQVVEFGLNLPPGVLLANSAVVSPDGRYIAVGVFKEVARILVYSLASRESRFVPGTEGGLFPFWSPDGSHLGFFVDGRVMQIEASGNGPATLICDAPNPSGFGTWNAENVILFSWRRRLFKVPATGGTPSPVELNGLRSGIMAMAPWFLPDNRHFIFFQGVFGGGTVRLESLDSADSRALVDSAYPAAFVPPNHVLFIRGTALVAQTLDLQTQSLIGPVSTIANGVAPGDLSTLPSVSGSASGVLTFEWPRGGIPGQLTWFDRNGRTAGEVAAPTDTEYLNPALSPDGQTLAVNSMDAQTGNWDIWTIDLNRQTPARLTSDPARDGDPVWSPEGKEIAFVSNRDGRFGIYRTPLGGSAQARLIAYVEGDPNVVSTTDWTRDGYVLYTQAPSKALPQAVWAVRADGGEPFVLLDKFSPYGARVSPDGKWVAYAAFDTRSVELYVEPFRAIGLRVAITHGGGTHARWRKDSRELFYWAVPGGVNAVDLTVDASGIHAGLPKTLVQSPILGLADFRAHYDASSDGQRFLARQPVGTPRPAVAILLHWTERLQ